MKCGIWKISEARGIQDENWGIFGALSVCQEDIHKPAGWLEGDLGFVMCEIA